MGKMLRHVSPEYAMGLHVTASQIHLRDRFEQLRHKDLVRAIPSQKLLNTSCSLFTFVGLFMEVAQGNLGEIIVRQRLLRLEVRDESQH